MKPILIVAMILSFSLSVAQMVYPASAESPKELEREFNVLKNSHTQIPQDNYDQEYKDQYRGHLSDEKSLTLRLTEKIFFAVGCGVFDVPAEASAAIRAWTADMIVHSGGLYNGSLFNEIREYERRGITDSKVSGACIYWKQHPDDVFRVRNFVSIAATPSRGPW